MYSAATAVLLAVFGLLLLIDLIFNADPSFGSGLSVVLIVLAGVAAVVVLFAGDRWGPWPALAMVLAHVVPAILFLTVLRQPAGVTAVILQMPVVSLYLGGFLRPWLARSTQFLVLLVFVVAVVIDPFQVVVEMNGGRNLPSIVCFTWLCLEAGIFVQKRFKQATHIDALTGLLNRRGFVDRSDIERARADRSGETLCVAMIDLDQFKRLNDSSGHASGDRILRDLAKQWKADARQTDALCRIGGDEFVFLMPNTDEAGAAAILTRLRENAVHPWSWGVAEWHPGELVSVAITRADESMYVQKSGEIELQGIVTPGPDATDRRLSA